ncbi:putative metal-dependent hydrolase [Undibacterium sp. GrIS 1.2]
MINQEQESFLKSRFSLLTKPLQFLLQLDLFSDSRTDDGGMFQSPRRKMQDPAPKKVTPSSLPVPPKTSSTPPEKSPNKRQIRLQEQWLEYSLLRSKRRTIGFLINDDGLRITAPRWVTIGDIEQAIHEKQRWIVAKITERRERATHQVQPKMVWADGAQLPYLGKQLTLRILATQSLGIHLDSDSNELRICLPADSGEQQLKDRVQAWLQQEARRVFLERLPVYAEKLDVSYHSMALSAATTRWGSCTSQGKIRLNWRLIHFSLTVIDYVIAHELSHLREMNHSPRFWATVQSVFPEFEHAKHALKQHAAHDLPIF